MTSRLSAYQRSLNLSLTEHNAAFPWGPRKVGKTTLLRQQFPHAKFYDLLRSDLRMRLLLHPALLREEVLANQDPVVVIDEIQKVPALLDEVHWCLENTRTAFIPCGSSTRKLRHGAANLLGGRAWRYELFPLTTKEIGEYDIERIVNHGLLPQHYREERPERSLRGYVMDYLEQEIQAEALTRNVPAFSRFLEAVSTTHGQVTGFSMPSSRWCYMSGSQICAGFGSIVAWATVKSAATRRGHMRSPPNLPRTLSEEAICLARSRIANTPDITRYANMATKRRSPTSNEGSIYWRRSPTRRSAGNKNSRCKSPWDHHYRPCKGMDPPKWKRSIPAPAS